MLINNIFEATLLGSAGIALVIVLKKSIFKRYTQTFNYYIWLFIIVRMILPLKVTMAIPEKIVPMKHTLTVNKNSTTINNNPLVIDNKSLAVEHSHYNSLTTFKILGYIWLLGFLIFLMHNIISYINFRSRLKVLSYDISEDNIKKIYSKLILEMKIKRKIALKYCNGISTPLGTGIFKSYILLPKVSYSNEEIEWILKHELMHYKRHDLIYKSLAMITVAIHWFNPLVYVMGKSINSDCELSCDEAILKNSNIEERKFYATILVDSIKINKNIALQSNLSTGLNNNKNNLKRRLGIMLNLEKRKKGIAAAALAAVLATSSFVSIKVFAESNDGKINTEPAKCAINNQVTSTNQSLNQTNKNNFIDADTQKLIDLCAEKRIIINLGTKFNKDTSDAEKSKLKETLEKVLKSTDPVPEGTVLELSCK